MAKGGFDVDLRDVASGTGGLFNASRGVEPVRAQETVARTAVDNTGAQLLQGVGNLFNSAVSALDTTIKRTVDERAREQMDQVFNEFGVGDVTTIEGESVDSEPLPSDIGKAERNLQKLTQARTQGGITDNAYWARVNSISRQLRSRFPGHIDYIDQTISRVSGGNPQLAIVRNLIEQQGRVDGAALREEKERSDFIDRHLAIMPTDYTDRNKYPTLDSLRKAVQPYLAAKEARANEREGITLARERGELTDKMEIESASRTAADVGMQLIGKGLGTVGEKYTDLVQNVRAISTGEKAATPEELINLRNQFNAFKYEYTQGLDTKLTEEYGQLSSKAREEARKVGLNMIETMESAITDKNIGLLNMLVNANETYKQGDQNTIMQNFPEYRFLQAMKEIGGPEAVSMALNVEDSTLRTVTARLATQNAIVDMFGAGKTVQESILRQKTLGQTAPEIAFVASGKAVEVLTDPKQTPAMRKRAAFSLFSTGNAGFVSSLNPTSRDGTKAQHAAAFNRLVNPNVHKAMLDLKNSGDEESWNNYVSWSNNTFTAVYQQNANTLAKAAQDRNYVIRWQGDRFEAFESAQGARSREENRIVGRGGGRFDTVMRPQVPSDIRVAVANMNGALNAMSSIVKDNGLTMTDFVRNTYQTLPSTVFEPIGPPPSRLGGTLRNDPDTGTGVLTFRPGDEGFFGERQMTPQQGDSLELEELSQMARQRRENVQMMRTLALENPDDPAAQDAFEKSLVDYQTVIQEINSLHNKWIEEFSKKPQS